MNFLGGRLLSLIAFLSAFWFWSSSLATSDASPIVAASHLDSSTPAVQRDFPLPSSKTIVIDARVNRGSLPPIYQAGYEITINAAGHVVITVTPMGTYASTPTAKQQILTREIGVAGLQALLNRLEQGGYFRLNLLRSTQGIRVGGPGNVIAVTLADGKWSMSGAELSPSAELQLTRMQGWIAAAVGFQPPADLLPGTPAAP